MRWWNISPRLKRVAASISLLAYKTVDTPVIVASTGRSGSTMLCHAIMNSMFRAKWNSKSSPRMVFYPAFDPQNLSLERGGVHKTHLLAHHFSSSVKSIFIFDNPVTSKESFLACCGIYGGDWGKAHLRNLESPFDIDEEAEGDLLNYQNQISSWFAQKGCLIVRYDKVWDYQKQISDFLGVNIIFPEKKERATKADKVVRNELESKLESVYLSLPEFVIIE